MANTLIKNVLCQEDTLDPDGFNRNQVKVLSCSLIVYYSDCVKKLYVSVPMYNITVGINPILSEPQGLQNWTGGTVVCIKVRTASFPRFWKNHP